MPPKLRRIAIPDLRERRFAETLLSDLDLRDLRTSADIKRSEIPDEPAWNRIVAVTSPMVPNPVLKSDGSPDLRYHTAGLAAKAWPLKKLLKLLNRAVSCKNRLTNDEFEDMIVYKGLFTRSTGRRVDAAYMMEFYYIPIYFRGGFNNFQEGVQAISDTAMLIERGKQTYL